MGQVLLGQGSTLSGISDTISRASQSQTSLRHMRLHMLVKDMKELSKQRLFRKDNIEDLEFFEHCIFGKRRVSFIVEARYFLCWRV